MMKNKEFKKLKKLKNDLNKNINKLIIKDQALDHKLCLHKYKL